MLNVKKVRPMFNNIVTTADKYEEDQMAGGLIVVPAGNIKEYQKVVAVGGSVRDIKEGDLVKVKFDRYMKMRHKKGSLQDGVIADNTAIEVVLPMILINNIEHLSLNDIDVEYVVEEYDETASSIIAPDNKIVLAQPTQMDTSYLRGGKY
jgi:co-chaperonin GroES (HSP10)